MSRRGRAAAVAVLSVAAAVALAGAPGASSRPAPGPAADDVPVNLTPIDRPDPEQPVPVTTDRYYDTFAEAEQTYRFERTLPESTLFFGLTLLDPDTDLDDGLGERSVIVVSTPEGRRCGRSSPDPGYSSELWSLTQGAGIDRTARCLAADEFELTVRRPKRVAEGAPFELGVYELPPATNRKELEFPTGDLDDQLEVGEPKRSLAPGATRPEASVLPDGEPVHVDLESGRPAWFAMTGVDTARWVVAHASATDPTGSFQGGRLEIRMVSPVGGLGSVPDDGTDPADSVTSIGRRPVLVEAHPWWLSSAVLDDETPATGYGIDDRLSAMPGTWYVVLRAVGVGPADGPLSVTLTGRVLRPTGNDYEPDVTQYAEPPPTLPEPVGAEPEPWTAPVVTPGPSGPQEQADPVAESDDAAEESRPWPVIAVLLGAAAVLAALGGVVWRRR